jgi:hypothetical protein
MKSRWRIVHAKKIIHKETPIFFASTKMQPCSYPYTNNRERQGKNVTDQQSLHYFINNAKDRPWIWMGRKKMNQLTLKEKEREGERKKSK